MYVNHKYYEIFHVFIERGRILYEAQRLYEVEGMLRLVGTKFSESKVFIYFFIYNWPTFEYIVTILETYARTT